jgi:methylthioribose-1-phosphate isomerase
VRTIDWVDDAVVIIDQRLLPDEVRLVSLESVADVALAIRTLAVRGAMALGVAGALGLALAAREAVRDRQDVAEAVESAAAELLATRPTAVNLGWGIRRVLARVTDGPQAVIDEALSMLDEDVHKNRRLSMLGADFLDEVHGPPHRVLTHCNAGALACVDWGTALGVVRSSYERGRLAEVLVPETRPLLQGARLTAWELGQLGIPHFLITDSAGPGLIAGGRVDAVVVGADRIAANGDVANKVGTYGLALAAARAGVPFIVAAPESTIDQHTRDGTQIPIEQRAGDEVVGFQGYRTAPNGTRALNPAFDITPADLVTAIVTEDRVIRIGSGEKPASTSAEPALVDGTVAVTEGVRR